MEETTLDIGGQFRSVTPTGQGGYAAGLLEETVGRRLRVQFRKPIPLDVALTVIDDGDNVDVLDSNRVPVLQAASDTDGLSSPNPVTIQEAMAASEASTVPPEFDGCYSCGTAGWGLRPGPHGESQFATTWTPPDWTKVDGETPARYVHTALDCPAGWFVASVPDTRLAVTAWMTVETFGPVIPGSPYAVVAWANGPWDGRKRSAGSAIFDDSGDLLARSESLWVSV